MKDIKFIKNVKDVLENNLCVGCGICGINKNVNFTENIHGAITPVFFDKNAKNSTLCPFSSINEDEDLIAKKDFPHLENKYSNELGYFDKVYAGHVLNKSERKTSSSGGLVTWICKELILTKKVDGIIHVKSNSNSKNLYKYTISYTIEDIKSNAKSRYYPITLKDVYEKVTLEKKKYAIVGIPCFIKASKIFLNKNPEIKKYIIYHIGILCGHLKTSFFVKLLAWQMGIKSNEISNADFRSKLKYYKATSYGFKVKQKNLQINNLKIKPKNDLYGTDWGEGFFKLKACDYCDDIFAETADVVIGDAWLPKYYNNPYGTNLILTRSNFFTKLLQKGFNHSEIMIEKISVDDAISSQLSSIKHRREGLSYRLAKDIYDNKAIPKKRVLPNINISKKRIEIYNQRIELRDSSNKYFLEAMKKNDLSIFFKKMKPITRKYQIFIKGSKIRYFIQIILAKIKKFLRIITFTYNKEIE